MIYRDEREVSSKSKQPNSLPFFLMADSPAVFSFDEMQNGKDHLSVKSGYYNAWLHPPKLRTFIFICMSKFGKHFKYHEKTHSLSNGVIAHKLCLLLIIRQNGPYN